MTAIRLILPEYPLYPTDSLRADEALLDRLARDYARSGAPSGRPDPGALDVGRFLFGFAPVHCFERIAASAASAPEGESLVWLMHVSGYFGGVWLRSEILRAQPDSPLVAGGQPPGQPAFRQRDHIDGRLNPIGELTKIRPCRQPL